MKLKKLIVLCIIVVICPETYASFEYLPLTAKVAATGQGSAIGTGNAASIFTNPADLANSVNWNFVSALNRPFGIKTLSSSMICGCVPLHFMTFGCGYNTFGFANYRETAIFAGGGFQVFSNTQLGFSLHFDHLHIKNKGSAATVGINLGIQNQISPKILLGVCATNINRPAIGKSKEKLPQTLSMGATFSLNSQIQLLGQLFKDIRYAPEPGFGLNYQPIYYLALHCGISPAAARYHAGLTLNLKMITFSYAVITHHTLPISHYVSCAIMRRPKPQVSGPKRNSCLDINQANLADFQKLPGIGVKTAQAILEFRQKVGFFTLPEQLLEIPGIGPATFNKIRPLICIKVAP